MLSTPLILAWLVAAPAPSPGPALRALAAGPPRLVSALDGGRALRREGARFAAVEREVTNWRTETVRALSPLPVAALAAGLRAERPVVTRCVKLNNYWCIKRAGWNGEVGFDDEGHVGFASAEAGADAAVTLLRRYYLEFGRRSALDIVRRWAPAGGCYAAGAPYRGPALAVRGLQNTVRARYLASRGLGRPLRGAGRVRVAAAGPAAGAAPARNPTPAASPPKPAAPAPKPAVPASRPPAAAPKPAASAPKPAATRTGLGSRPGVSAVPLRPLPAFRVPDIAAGMGERRVATLSASLIPPAPRAPQRAARPAPPAALRGGAAPRAATAGAAPRAGATKPSGPAAQPAAVAAAAPAPAPVICGSEETRIRNYAGRIVVGLGVGPADDLALFEPDGRPKPNLARVLLAMSGFELGYLRASPALVIGAVERQEARARAAIAAALPIPSTPAPVETP